MTAVAVQTLKGLPGGLSIDTILTTDPSKIHECILNVGFHRKKLHYLTNIAHILKNQYNGDVPNTYQGKLLHFVVK